VALFRPFQLADTGRVQVLIHPLDDETCRVLGELSSRGEISGAPEGTILETFLSEFVSSLQQVEVPTGLAL